MHKKNKKATQNDCRTKAVQAKVMNDDGSTVDQEAWNCFCKLFKHTAVFPVAVTANQNEICALKRGSGW